MRLSFFGGPPEPSNSAITSAATCASGYHPVHQTDVEATALLSNDTPRVHDEYGENEDDLPAPDATEHRDAAATMLLSLGHDPASRPSISPATNARILRRIDLALLPVMLSIYFLHALDKATLSYAAVFGLVDDTHLRGEQFSWLASVVFLAQLLFQLPLAWLLVKLPVGKFAGAMAVGWGLTLTGMAWARSFEALLGARFLLGAFEAAVGPSLLAITQMWWKRGEQTLRVGSWYCMNGLTWVVGSLVTYGLASIDTSLKPYQVIFLFFGVVTVAVAAVMFLWMPDSPIEAKFLSNEDKIIAIERLRDNQMGIMSREWRMDHVYETLRDVKTWLWFALIFCTSAPSNGIGTFGPLIIESFVSDPFQTMLFNVPVGVAHALTVIVSAYVSMKCKIKGPVIAVLCVPPIIGLIILLRYPHDAEHKSILLAGFFCLCTFTGITPLLYSWSGQNTAGDTKRKFTSAIVFFGSSAGNILGPLLFTPGEAPAYTRGLYANVFFFSLVICLVIVTTIYLRRLNASHALRRHALGRSYIVTDGSLETTESSTLIIATHGDADEALDDDSSRKYGSKAFTDTTDLLNEDFIFVY